MTKFETYDLEAIQGIFNSDMDLLVQLLDYNIYIPDELKDVVKDSIKTYSTRELSESTIQSYIDKEISLADNLYKYDKESHKFRGHVAEWLICMEYNLLKNKGNVVLTIVNPDPTSKADLIHIIKTKDGYIHKPGPDVKTGSVKYVLKEFERIASSRYDIPMIDVDGALRKERTLRNYTPSQIRKLDELDEKYPNKKPLPSQVNPKEINLIMKEYLIYRATGILPSKRKEVSLNTKEEKESFKNKVRNSKNVTNMSVSWSDYKKKLIDYNEKSKEWNYNNVRDNEEIGEKRINIPNSDPKGNSTLLNKINIFFKKKYEDAMEDPVENIILPLIEVIKVGRTIHSTYKNIKYPNVESLKNYEEKIENSNKDSLGNKCVKKHTVKPNYVPPFTKRDGTPVRGYSRGLGDGYTRGGSCEKAKEI